MQSLRQYSVATTKLPLFLQFESSKDAGYSCHEKLYKIGSWTEVNKAETAAHSQIPSKSE